jgi:hypothetical protein
MDCALVVVVNKSQLSEPVREETDPRADCSFLHSIAFGDERSYGFLGAVSAAKPAGLTLVAWKEGGPTNKAGLQE